MPVRVLVPTPLRPFVGGSSSVDVEGGTVAEALAELLRRHDGVRKHLFDAEGGLRSFVNLYVNDEDVRTLSKMETKLRDGDVVSIVPAVAGGSPWRA